MTNKKNLGNWGERQALKYLLNNNYQLLARNWRFGRKELDLIMISSETIIAVEVKTRRSPLASNQPLLKISQLTRLRQALKAYCHLNNYSYQKTRLDLITLVSDPNQHFKLHHYRDL